MAHCNRAGRGCRQPALWLIEAQGEPGSYAAHACERHRAATLKQASRWGEPRIRQLADTPAEPDTETQLDLFTTTPTGR